jgi:alkanesulfonate monooxygenase SsuD/methylene tetrahydromethanopterin reductase-like flavin-dependent oxidoreductase (luciferase family)
VDAWLCYDLRTYPGGASSAAMASAAIEQAAWADDKGFAAVLLPEHHGCADGYDPSPFVLAAAMASRTSRIRFMIGAVLLPLHNPLRVAEDAVTLDVISQGRVDLTSGLGYVPSEFEMFGVAMRKRGALADEGLATLLAAFTGEPFSYRGRTVRVTPAPVHGRIPLYVGGAVAASARRAARFGDGFFPTVPTAELAQLYLDECAAMGRAPGRVISMALPPLFIHVAEDPDKAWAQIAPHAVNEMTEYGRWAAEAAALSTMDSPYQEAPDPDGLRASGVYAVVTPAEAVGLIRRIESAGRVVNFKPMMGGLSPDLAWESLELYAGKVLPALRGAAG